MTYYHVRRIPSRNSWNIPEFPVHSSSYQVWRVPSRNPWNNFLDLPYTHRDIMSGGSPLDIHVTSLDFPYTHCDIMSGGSPLEIHGTSLVSHTLIVISKSVYKSMEHSWISCTLTVIPSPEDPLQESMEHPWISRTLIVIILCPEDPL